MRAQALQQTVPLLSDCLQLLLQLGRANPAPCTAHPFCWGTLLENRTGHRTILSCSTTMYWSTIARAEQLGTLR